MGVTAGVFNRRVTKLGKFLTKVEAQNSRKFS